MRAYWKEKPVENFARGLGFRQLREYYFTQNLTWIRLDWFGFCWAALSRWRIQSRYSILHSSSSSSSSSPTYTSNKSIVSLSRSGTLISELIWDWKPQRESPSQVLYLYFLLIFSTLSARVYQSQDPVTSRYVYNRSPKTVRWDKEIFHFLYMSVESMWGCADVEIGESCNFSHRELPTEEEPSIWVAHIHFLIWSMKLCHSMGTRISQCK